MAALMMEYAVGLIVVLCGCLIGAFFRKFWIAVLWPIVFVYPHALLSGLLPYNAGLDDVLIVMAAIAVVISCKRLRFDVAGKAALAFLLIVCLGEVTGRLALDVPARFGVKSALKAVVFVSFFSAFYWGVRSRRDVWLVVCSYVLSLCGACVISIGDWYGASWVQAFVLIEPGEFRYRATGPFLSPAGAGLAIALGLAVLAPLLGMARRYWVKGLVALAILLVTTTLLAAQTRTGILASGVIIVLLVSFSQNRRFLIPVALMLIYVALHVPNLMDALDSRWAHTVQQWESGGPFEATGCLAAMENSWRIAAGGWTILCGSGRGVFSHHGELPHNGFLTVLLIYGLIGCVWLVGVVHHFSRSAISLLRMRSSAELPRFLGLVWILALGAMLVASLTSDPAANSFVAYSFACFSAVFLRMAVVPEVTKRPRVRGVSEGSAWIDQKGVAWLLMRGE